MSFAKARFNTYVLDANFGKIQFFADSDAGIEDDEFRFKVVDPAGITVRDYPGTADYTIPGAPPGGFQTANTFAIPLDSTGLDFLRGTYTIYLKFSSGGDDTITSVEYDFQPAVTYQKTNAKDGNDQYYGLLTADVNCVTKVITFEDETDYTGWTIVQDDITIMPPLIAGEAAPVAETTEDVNALDSPIATISFTWTNVAYTGTLTAKRTFSSDESLTDVLVIEDYQSVIATAVGQVTCGPLGYCDFLGCADSTFNAAYQEACRVGWAKVSTQMLANLNALTTMLQLYDMHARCGNNTQAAAYRLKIEAMVGDSCDCGCGGTTVSNAEPRPLD